MRTFLIALASVAALSTPALAASLSPAAAAALASGDWRTAAVQGATAADIVRALQARGRFAEMNPDECVVTLSADNQVDAVVPLKPLPPLPADAARTADLGGTGFTFTAPRGTITLYPAYAASFAGARRAPPSPP